jgi:hypothetical protein
MIYRCGSPVTEDRSRCGCDDDCGMVTDLTHEEFRTVAFSLTAPRIAD